MATSPNGKDSSNQRIPSFVVQNVVDSTADRLLFHNEMTNLGLVIFTSSFADVYSFLDSTRFILDIVVFGCLIVTFYCYDNQTVKVKVSPKAIKYEKMLVVFLLFCGYLYTKVKNSWIFLGIISYKRLGNLMNFS